MLRTYLFHFRRKKKCGNLCDNSICDNSTIDEESDNSTQDCDFGNPNVSWAFPPSSIGRPVQMSSYDNSSELDNRLSILRLSKSVSSQSQKKFE